MEPFKETSLGMHGETAAEARQQQTCQTGTLAQIEIVFL